MTDGPAEGFPQLRVVYPQSLRPHWRDVLLIKEGSEDYLQNSHRLDDLRLTASGLSTVETVDFIKLLLETLEALDSNASPRLALEVLMIKLPGANVSA